MALKPGVLARWRALVVAQAATQRAINEATQSMLSLAWGNITDPTDQVQIDKFTKAAADAVKRGRQNNTDLMQVTLRKALTDAGIPAPKFKLTTADHPRGMPLTDEFERPFKQWRYDLSRDKATGAPHRALARALTMAQTDLALARTSAFKQAAAQSDEIVGWRRVVHPELSKSGTCGLCIAAATRVYQKSNLMPLHDHCECVPWPVLAGDSEDDIAQRINGQDLNDLYTRIGETGRSQLSHARFAVHEHGELGPVLGKHGDDFRGPGDVHRDANHDTPIGDHQAA